MAKEERLEEGLHQARVPDRNVQQQRQRVDPLFRVAAMFVPLLAQLEGACGGERGFFIWRGTRRAGAQRVGGRQLVLELQMWRAGPPAGHRAPVGAVWGDNVSCLSKVRPSQAPQSAVKAER